MKKNYITPQAKMVCLEAELMLAYSTINVNDKVVEEGDGTDASNRRDGSFGGGLWDDM